MTATAMLSELAALGTAQNRKVTAVTASAETPSASATRT